MNDWLALACQAVLVAKAGLPSVARNRRLEVPSEGWWLGAELNRRHKDFQSSALPTELPSHSTTYEDFFLPCASICASNKRKAFES